MAIQADEQQSETSDNVRMVFKYDQGLLVVALLPAVLTHLVLDHQE